MYFYKVKEGLEIKNVSLMLSILGMALLLMFSPCKVRNFIEVELGLPQTEVLNKSQSIVSQSDCQSFEASEIVQTNSQPTLHQPDFLFTDASNIEISTNLPNHLFTSHTSVFQQVADIPLYILYQNLKIHA